VGDIGSGLANLSDDAAVLGPAKQKAPKTVFSGLFVE